MATPILLKRSITPYQLGTWLVSIICWWLVGLKFLFIIAFLAVIVSAGEGIAMAGRMEDVNKFGWSDGVSILNVLFAIGGVIVLAVMHLK